MRAQNWRWKFETRRHVSPREVDQPDAGPGWPGCCHRRFDPNQRVRTMRTMRTIKTLHGAARRQRPPPGRTPAASRPRPSRVLQRDRLGPSLTQPTLGGRFLRALTRSDAGPTAIPFHACGVRRGWLCSHPDRRFQPGVCLSSRDVEGRLGNDATLSSGPAPSDLARQRSLPNTAPDVRTQRDPGSGDGAGRESIIPLIWLST